MDTKIMLPISKQRTKSIGKMLKMESTQLMNFISILRTQFDLLISVLFYGGFKQLLTLHVCTFCNMYLTTGKHIPFRPPMLISLKERSCARKAHEGMRLQRHVKSSDVLL